MTELLKEKPKPVSRKSVDFQPILQTSKASDCTRPQSQKSWKDNGTDPKMTEPVIATHP